MEFAPAASQGANLVPGKAGLAGSHLGLPRRSHDSGFLPGLAQLTLEVARLRGSPETKLLGLGAPG